MKWKFEINEISNGSYKCIGKRVTGNIVSLQCEEGELFRIFKQAYEVETDLGTLPSKSLFSVVSGAKQDWVAEYNDEAFGSWIVKNNNGYGYYVYDGKDFHLMIYGSSEKPIWQGFVKNKTDAEDSIFQHLIQ